MSVPEPVAVGYAAASSPAELYRQHEVIEDHARAGGLALAQIVTDARDALTIGQVVEAARHHGASVVLVPADAALADARKGLNQQLSEYGAGCIVLPVRHPSPASG